MNNRIILLIAAVLSVASACQRPYEKEYPELQLSSDEVIVKADEGKCVVTVYYSGEWTVEPASDASWVRIEDGSAAGVGDFRLVYTKNEGPSRSCPFNIKLDIGGTREFTLVQKGRSGVSLAYANTNYTLSGDAITLHIPFTTTLSKNFLDSMTAGLVPSEAASWVSGARIGENELIVNLAENTGAGPRSVTLNSYLTDAVGDIYGQPVEITQDNRNAYISVPESKRMRKSAAIGTIAIDTNLGSFADSIKVTVSYPSATEAFVQDVKLKDGRLDFSIGASEIDRSARFTFIYDNGAGIHLEQTTDLLQTTSIVKEEIPVSALVAAFRDEPVQYLSSSDESDDFVTLYVVGGRNPNMEENLNTDANTITTDENDRTFYAQDDPENPTVGFRIRFSSPEANHLSHGDRIELVLSETTLLREASPQRHSILDVSPDLVEVVETDVTMRPVQKTLSTLSPQDTYTYVKVSGLEFQVKEGCFSNVREYDAVRNPYTPDGMQPNQYSSNNQFAKDGAANLLFDADGNVIYMLVNMACEWRRLTDEKVPQGVGDVAGVLVHSTLPRWGGNVGLYSIRPLTREDIEFDGGSSSNYNTLAAWVLTKGNNREAIIADYNWLGGYVQGEGGQEQLPQNKLLATHGPQTETAVLYSENLMPQRSNNSTLKDPQYPITAQSGYRGLEASDPNSAPKFGMSKGSVISISSNPSGWLEWDGDGNWTGGVKGVVLEFSTEGVSGSLASIGFNAAAGRMNPDNKTNAFWQHQTSYPVSWKVQMAVSDDGGATWSAWSDARNQATGDVEFTMQSNPWAGNSLSHYYSYTAGTKGTISTPADNPFGIPSYRFALPPSFFGHARVRVRLVPATDIVATYNSDWSLPQDAAQMHAVPPSKQKQNVHNNILLEDIYIQYR